MSSGMVLDLLWSDAVEKEEGCCLWMFLPALEGRVHWMEGRGLRFGSIINKKINK